MRTIDDFERASRIEWKPACANTCQMVKEDEYINEASQVSPSLGYWVSKVIEHTEYIPYIRLIRLLEKALHSLEVSIGQQPFTLMFTYDGVYTSEEYMVQLLWSRLRMLNLVDIYVHGRDTEIKTPIVVWIDDASYSGGNQSQALFTLENMPLVKELHVVLAATGSLAQERMKIESAHLPFSVYSHIGIQVPSLYDLYGESASILDNYYWGGTRVPGMYFDHKIASEQSTYAAIYHGIVPSREFTEDELIGMPTIIPGKKVNILNCIPSRTIIEQLQEYH